jgi:hypothetical protein
MDNTIGNPKRFYRSPFFNGFRKIDPGKKGELLYSRINIDKLGGSPSAVLI